MRQHIYEVRYLLLFLIILVTSNVKADTWDSPRIKKYYSGNQEFMLEITPTITPEKFYQWEYYKNNKHPQTRRILRRKKKFLESISEQDTILTPCFGKLYHIEQNDTTLIWNRKLLNEVCPVSAMISNDGSSVITFDNWYTTGYGPNTFVVYNEYGDANATYKLEEITPFPLNDYLRSISSIYWRKSSCYIDNERIEIIFVTDDDRQKKKIYNFNEYAFEENAP